MADKSDETEEGTLSRGSSLGNARKSRLGIAAFVLAVVPSLSMLGTLVYGVLDNSLTPLFMGGTGFLAATFGGTALVLALVAKKQIRRSAGQIAGSKAVSYAFTMVLTVVLIGVVWGALEWMLSAPNRMVAAAMHGDGLEDQADKMCKVFETKGVSERFVLQEVALADSATQAGKPELAKRMDEAVRAAYREKRMMPIDQNSAVFWRLRGSPPPEL